MNSTFWLATINPTKTLRVHRVRSIPGLCLTKGPRTAVLPAAESAVQSAGHVASRRGSACGRRNRGRRAWRGCGRGHGVQKPCGLGCPGSQHDLQSSTINWPGMAQVDPGSTIQKMNSTRILRIFAYFCVLLTSGKRTL